jgi:hypothetical protein
MYPHRIRLHGPWECEPLAAPDQPIPPPPRRIRVPARLHDAGLSDFAGRVRLTRQFGYPGRIDEYEHVWLTFADVVGQADVALNGTTLCTGRSAGLEFEATSLLASRNRLEVILDAASGDAGLAGEVALEIRRDAFLRDVAACHGPGGTIRVTGFVVGSSIMPLELYALAAGQHVYYSPIAACAAGQPFDFAFTPESPPQQVQIELVCVAERWYVVEAPVIEPKDAG